MNVKIRRSPPCACSAAPAAPFSLRVRSGRRYAQDRSIRQANGRPPAARFSNRRRPHPNRLARYCCQSTIGASSPRRS